MAAKKRIAVASIKVWRVAVENSGIAASANHRFFYAFFICTLTHTVLLEGVRESLVEERSGEGLLK